MAPGGTRRHRHRRPSKSILRSGAVRSMAGRLSWGLGDQAVSSMTNFAVGIYVARSLGAVAFGVFSLAWVTYGVILNVSRGLATDPLMVRFSAVSPDAWRTAVGKSSGTALAVGVVTGVLSVLVGLALGGSLGVAFIALGIVLPAVMLQDAWRFAFFAAGQGRRAFLNDSVQAVALIPAMLIAAHFGSVFGFLLAWGLSAGVAAGFGCFQTGMMPRFTGVSGWLRQHRDLGVRYLVENVSNSGASQLRAYGLGAIAGLASVGVVRGAELTLGPFLALLMGLSLVTVAEGARVLRRSPHRLRLFCILLGAAQASAAALWGLTLLFAVPDSFGRFVLGALWNDSSRLILPVTLAVVGASFTSGASAGLRALGAARRSLRSQLIASAAYVTFGLTGAAMGGALGSAWGVALATLTGSGVWWLQLHIALREYHARPPEVPELIHFSDNEITMEIPVIRALPLGHEEMRTL
jgi:O-antigen/teichoic acid export membrane protein